MRGFALALLTLALAVPAGAAAQVSDELGDPSEAVTGERVHVASSVDGDRAHATSRDAPGDGVACRTPCDLRLAPGRYEITFDLARVGTGLDVTDRSLVLSARPQDDWMLGLGIAGAIAGLALAGTAALTDLRVCVEGPRCPEWVPIALGIGGLAFIGGLIVAFEAPGEVQVTALGRSHGGSSGES